VGNDLTEGVSGSMKKATVSVPVIGIISKARAVIGAHEP
jgi:hypothetical protein